MAIQHIRNFRDVKGYRNDYGEWIKPQMIFRGASLDAVDDKELVEMSQLGIKYILDFRDEQEALLAPDRYINQMEYIRIKAMSGGFDFGELLKKGFTMESLTMMNQYLKMGYETMPFDNPAYHRLFELLLKNDGKVYFHCSAGKDRTGIAAFLIMIALGCSKEDAINEYLLSNQYLKQKDQELASILQIPKEIEALCEPLLYVQKESILCSIHAIQKKYETFDDFLFVEYGLDQKKRKRLREIYCEMKQ
ncbi:MAG: tyrosine-protein phosphatase [Erysipelotrichaceae bacterium]|nr:tyrosine-protein phosphatase [Erysipelotrichaceae bacterium]